jgi:hypothetical protein
MALAAAADYGSRVSSAHPKDAATTCAANNTAATTAAATKLPPLLVHPKLPATLLPITKHPRLAALARQAAQL